MNDVGYRFLKIEKRTRCFKNQQVGVSITYLRRAEDNFFKLLISLFREIR